jgi:hypothetical protein
VEVRRFTAFDAQSFGIERDADQIRTLDLIDGPWRIRRPRPNGSSQGDVTEYSAALAFAAAALAETAP